MLKILLLNNSHNNGLCLHLVLFIFLHYNILILHRINLISTFYANLVIFGRAYNWCSASLWENMITFSFHKKDLIMKDVWIFKLSRSQHEQVIWKHVEGDCKFVIVNFQMLISKQNMFNKKWTWNTYNSILKLFFIHNKINKNHFMNLI